MRSTVPLQLPGYAAVEPLYTGVRSTVYRARSNLDGRRVVLKVAHSTAGMLDESLARLRHEMAILTAIHSDRVVRALDVVRVGDDAALVLEDFGGESLDRYLARARFSLGDTLGLAIGVVAALRDVHAAGIIHKDVTPSNIVYNAATGQARLIDFDIATAWRTERHGFAPPSMLEGTLHYMAPEQTGRMNRVIDSRADLYAFGVTLFELLTGQRPFADGDILSIVHAHVAVRAPEPDEIDPAIPRPVAAIVSRLLAKAPEDRYQTAAGLFADLRTCVERFAVTGAIADFALGRDDVASRFELPTKLYGRRAELDALTGAFERVSAGGVEAVLVTGHSGVGKTSIVRELFPLITRERGRFVTGKFDQLRGDAPYPALIAALDGLIHQLLTESEDDLVRWRDLIAAAIAPNAQVVIDALPVLERILGAQPPVIALDAAGTQSRFMSTLQRFLQVFTRRSHPLVVFLDDLQWADPESVQLLKAVALSHATESLLLIAAYRDGEVSDGHPVAVAAGEIAERRRVTRIAVAPLPIDDTAALIADALHRSPAEIAALAQLVCRKTDGNPFFVRQLLLALHEAGHIAFDARHGWFGFDAAAIERAPISENVADLLADNLRKLPESTRRVLAIAAAFGNRFELDLVALIAEDSPVAVQAELGAALGDDLVVPLSELEYVASPRGAGLVLRRLRFQHDRVQRAAYALMSPDEAQRMHLRICRLLLASAPAGELGRREPGAGLFEVVSHGNRAVALLGAAERKQLAQLDLRAARKARASAAYAAAVEFLRVAVACLDWDADYADQLDAHTMLAECCYLSGDPRRATAVIDEAEARVVHHRDHGTLEALRATLHIHADDMAAAIRATRAAAALLGHALPDDPAALVAALGAKVAEIVHSLGGRGVEDLIDLPEMTDLDALALTVVLRNCMPAAFQLEGTLGAYMTAQIVMLSLTHGNCAISAYGYCTFAGVLLATPLHELAYRFGKLGLELNHRRDDRAERPAVAFLFGLFSAPWRAPIHEAIRYLREAARIGREISDHIHGGNAGALEISMRMFRGAEPLAEICHDARIYRQQCREVGDPATTRLLTWQIDRMRVLMGEIESLTDENPDSQVTVFATRGEANVAQQFNLLHALVDLAYAGGDEVTALELALATRQLEASVPRMVIVVDHRFWLSLAALAVCRRDAAQRVELAPVIEANQLDLAQCAEGCPANFEAMYLLVEAERARLTGDLAATLALYDRATASAAQHGRRRLEALAHELHGQLWADRGKPEIAQLYLARACNLYATLGMQRKVRMLERKHPGVVRAAPLRTTGTITSSTTPEVVDVLAIARATRAISGELERDKLLARMLEIMFENAGAEGGAIVLDETRGLVVAASRTDRAPQITTTGVPLTSAALPRSILHYVQRTRTPVVLDDATTDRRFGNDDYIRTRAPRSVLCMPIVHKDRAMGMVYLENTLVSGAFTQAQLDALTILSSQIAVSLDNATLYAAQRVHAEASARANHELRAQIAVREQAEQELARYRDHLEELIAERTQELIRANQRLRDAAAERERIEAELRLAQKLESVGRLAAGIAHEINTPVQFVTDNVTFVRDALPGLIAATASYRALAAAVADGGDVGAALAAATTAAADADVDYVIAHTPPALDTALDGLGRVAAIVRSMKEFAHPDRDEKTLVDLNRAIESTLMVAAHECKYVAEVSTELAELPLVRCNAGEINQAILNLVINAAHAIHDVVGHSGAKGRIDVRTRRDGNEVEIAIRDTGGGIPAAIRDKIYDPFFTTKQVGRGTGQGLAIVRSVVVDKHGGSLRFETAQGAGTTFFVRLPVGPELDPTM